MKLTEEQKQLVKELRDKTGYGMMDCRKALENYEWDIDKAVIWLADSYNARSNVVMTDYR